MLGGMITSIAPNPTSSSIAETFSRTLQAAARALGLQLHVLHASTERDFDTVIACAGATIHHREPPRRGQRDRYPRRRQGRARWLHVGDDDLGNKPRQRWLRSKQRFCTGRADRLYANRGDDPSVVPSEIACGCNRAGKEGTRQGHGGYNATADHQLFCRRAI